MQGRENGKGAVTRTRQRAGDRGRGRWREKVIIVGAGVRARPKHGQEAEQGAWTGDRVGGQGI